MVFTNENSVLVSCELPELLIVAGEEVQLQPTENSIQYTPSSGHGGGVRQARRQGARCLQRGVRP